MVKPPVFQTTPLDPVENFQPFRLFQAPVLFPLGLHLRNHRPTGGRACGCGLTNGGEREISHEPKAKG